MRSGQARWIQLGATLLCAGLGALPLAAQNEESDVLDSDQEPSAEPEPQSQPTPAEPSDSVEPEEVGQNVETIYVIQVKPRLVSGSFEFAPQYVQSVNDRFTSHLGFLVSGIYHLRENVAFELAGGYLWGRDSDMTTEIRYKEKLAPENVQRYRLNWVATADMQWSPAYGKVILQDLVLGQFNLYLSVGAGATGLYLEDWNTPGKPYPELVAAPQLTTTFGGGLRFYFTDWLGVRFEVRDYVQPLVAPKEIVDEQYSTFDVSNTVLAQLGVSFVF